MHAAVKVIGALDLDTITNSCNFSCLLSHIAYAGMILPGALVERKETIRAVEPAFALDRVSVAYTTDEGIKPVLLDIHLHIAAGDWVMIVGRNGSGKSTLVRVLARLCPISRGQLVCGAAASDTHSVQMIFQNPDAQIVGETVYEDICFGLENIAVPPQDMPLRVSDALSMVGLEHAAQRRVAELSGGQKQLLCIADALAMNATTLLFDEATSMLDPFARQRIITLAKRLQEQGKTIIWVTQLMDELGYANRVVALDAGRIVFDDHPTKFFYAEDGTMQGESVCTSLGFVPPYTVQVAQQLLRAGTVLPYKPMLTEELKGVIHQLCQ